MLTTDLLLALRNLGRNRNRAAVAVFTVASGVIAFLLAGGFIAWIFQDMREATIHSQLGHAQIVRPAFFDKGIADPYGFMLPADQKDLQALQALPGVISITPRLMLSGLISRGETTIAFAGEGIDPVREKPISTRIRILAGNDLASAARHGAWLCRPDRHHHGTGAGRRDTLPGDDPAGKRLPGLEGRPHEYRRCAEV